jgi:transposase
MQTEDLLREKYSLLLPHLNEKERRLVLASDAKSYGRGGLSLISKIVGVSRVTLNSGLRDLEKKIDSDKKNQKTIRKSGGGRKKETVKNVELQKTIEEIVSPHTMGDPMKTLQWTSKSLRNIAELAKERGFTVSHELVKRILKELGYSLQSNRKTHEGGKHEDRNAQFEHINRISTSFLKDNQPVISVDCKKKEVLGNLKNNGKDWFVKKEPTQVKVYDFIDKNLGKAIPYGVYDLANNEGWVSVGVSSDTASFAVASIRSWWHEMGKIQFPNATQIYITADGGGSNSSRSKLWKKELQLFANETKLEITVSHYPPGTSKWNKIEHKLFSYISMNWRAKPLLTLQIVVNLIASTTTKKGLKVNAKIDESIYEKGIVVTKGELDQIEITKNEFHGEWNYTIKPNNV